MVHDEEEWDMLAPVLPATPPDGWTLDNLPPDLPAHTELIRGTLVMSPQKAWHSRAVVRLFNALDRSAPEQYVVEREMAIRRSARSAPEPDVSIVHAKAYDPDKCFYLPEEVLLVAEVVSPESEERDREDKPMLYAAMGIPTFWLVERGRDKVPIVHEHHLYGGSYRLMRSHIDRLVTDRPFDIDIPLVDPTAAPTR